LHVFFCATILQQLSTNAISIVVSHLVNLVALENKFKTLVEYVEYKLFKQDIKSPMVGVWKKD
jgi:hypothetical protein